MRILKNCSPDVRAAVKMEAARRLLLLDVEGHARKSCASVGGRLYRSETVNQNIQYVNIDRMPERYTIGVNYYLNENEMKAVNEFEKKFNSAVYFVLLSNTEFGPLYSFLYINLNDPEEWNDDKRDLMEVLQSADGVKFLNPYAFCCQIDEAGDISGGEFGRIGIRPAGGGVIRIY